MATETRAPFLEADVNTTGSDNLRVFNRGWWPFKGFSSSIVLKSKKATAVSEEQPSEWQIRFPCSVIISSCANTSLSAILAQVSVGPLQSVTVLQKIPCPVVVLEFNSTGQASIFRCIIKSGRYIVNGFPVFETRITNEWATQMLDAAPSLVSQLNLSMCRRTLEIFREIDMAHSTTESGRPSLMTSDVHPLYLKKVFGQIGPIVQVRPMIYHCYVAFAIDYTCVSDAVRAKDLFEEEVSRPQNMPLPVELLFKELFEWRLEFSKDFTERRVCYKNLG